MATFADCISASDANNMKETDIANALRTFAHFQYMHGSIELLIKQSIKRSQDFKLQTLAVIMNSLADLDIANPTLLHIVKQILLAKIDENAPIVQVPKGKEIQPNSAQLMPKDCAMFMTSFCRSKIMFD